LAELLTAAAELNTDRTKELSGSNTPLESMPPWLAAMAQVSPTTHFVSFAQAILYRGAGIAVVWSQFVIVALVGSLFLGLALLRFRRVAAALV
jgi:ABC-2 type transport system permease protein